MARRLAGVSLLLAIAVAACGGGSSRGLVALQETIAGFTLRCGQTATWEAGVIANATKKPARIVGVRLFDPPPGFRIAWVRAYRGSIHTTDESRAKSLVLGNTIPPSRVTSLREASLDDSPVWHVVVGLRPPPCSRTSLRKTFSLRSFEFRGGTFAIDYRIGDETRTLRLGAVATGRVCSGRREFCRP